MYTLHDMEQKESGLFLSLVCIRIVHTTDHTHMQVVFVKMKYRSKARKRPEKFNQKCHHK